MLMWHVCYYSMLLPIGASLRGSARDALIGTKTVPGNASLTRLRNFGRRPQSINTIDLTALVCGLWTCTERGNLLLLICTPGLMWIWIIAQTSYAELPMDSATV